MIICHRKLESISLCHPGDLNRFLKPGCFLNANHMVFVPKPKPSISTEMWNERNRKIQPKTQNNNQFELICGFVEMYLANV